MNLFSRPFRVLLPLLLLAAEVHAFGGAQRLSAPRKSGARGASPARSIQSLVAAYHALGHLEGAVLVAEGGKVIYQGAFGQAVQEWRVPNTTDTAFRIASLSKQFTAAMVLKLVEKGQLRLDIPVSTYLPELRKDLADRITLHHLLSHTSGLVDYVNSPGFWSERMGAKVPRAEILALINRDLESAPGALGHYNNSGYYLLGLILEKVTGRAFEVLLQELVLDPLGLSRTGYDAPDQVVARKAFGYTRQLGGASQTADPFYIPNAFSGGGMYSTVGDFFKWDRALRSDTFLSKASKEVMFKAYAPDDVMRDLGFGYGWLVGTRKLGGRDVSVHEHGGNTNGYASLITRFPDEDRLIVILLNEGSGSKAGGIYRLRTELTNLLYGQPVTLPRRTLAEALSLAIRTQGLVKAIAAFPNFQNAEKATGPNELNQLGYDYLLKGRLEEALALFKLNADLFPEDWNVHDSLGEAYLVRGENAAGAASYRRSLQLNPKNNNAIEVLKKLEP